MGAVMHFIKNKKHSKNMKKILLTLLLISSQAFSMEETYLPEETKTSYGPIPIYTKAMVDPEAANTIHSGICRYLWPCYLGTISDKIKAPEELHMSLTQVAVDKQYVLNPKNPIIKAFLADRYESFYGAKFHITGIEPDFGNHVVLTVEPDGEFPGNILEMNPHISIFRSEDPEERRKFFNKVYIDSLMEETITFGGVTFELRTEDMEKVGIKTKKIIKIDYGYTTKEKKQTRRHIRESFGEREYLKYKGVQDISHTDLSGVSP